MTCIFHIRIQTRVTLLIFGKQYIYILGEWTVIIEYIGIIMFIQKLSPVIVFGKHFGSIPKVRLECVYRSQNWHVYVYAHTYAASFILYYTLGKQYIYIYILDADKSNLALCCYPQTIWEFENIRQAFERISASRPHRCQHLPSEVCACIFFGYHDFNHKRQLWIASGKSVQTIALQTGHEHTPSRNWQCSRKV